MYGFIWRRLPGNVWYKLAQTLVLLTGIGALLWFIVFPWAEPLLPFDDVQVGDTSEVTVDPSRTADPGGVLPYPTVNNPEPSTSELAN